MNDHADNPEVVRCLALALARRDSGEELCLAEICEGDAELIRVVQAALEMAPNIGDLHEEASWIDPLQGALLADRYELLMRIGDGAMGIVYRAHDRGMSRDVAIKVLRDDLVAGESPRRRFDREAEALATVRHANVVTVFDRGMHNGRAFLVLELIEGTSLADLLEPDGMLPNSEQLGGSDQPDAAHSARTANKHKAAASKTVVPGIARLLRHCPQMEQRVDSWVGASAMLCAALADGLHAAHKHGVHHRDVKPSNVLLRRDGSPVLLDFGLAAWDSKTSLATRDGTIGTPAYMAPEQLTRKPSDTASVAPDRATPRSDVYGLGATLYHLVTMQPPYQGTVSEVLTDLHRAEPQPASKLNPAIPRDLAAILDKSMARRPEQRYASAAEMAADLRAFVAYEPVRARPISPLRRSWRRLSRQPALRATAALLVVGSAATLTWKAWEQRIAERLASAERLREQLPSDLSLSTVPEARIIADADVRAGIANRLDRIVADSADPTIGRLQRALFRLDHGDLAGANSDMQALCSAHSSVYLTELANRYARLAPAPPSQMDEGQKQPLLSLDNMPQPDGAQAKFAAAMHSMRRLNLNDNKAHLAALEQCSDWFRDAIEELGYPAREFLLTTQLSQAIADRNDQETRRTRFESCHEDARNLEGLFGHPTFATTFVSATALVYLGRDEDSLARFSDCLKLAPGHFGARLNYASALRRCDRLEAAHRQLDLAVDLRPDSPKALHNFVNLLCQRARYSQARAIARSATKGVGIGARNVNAYLLAVVDLHEAVDAYNAGSRKAAKDAAAKALARFDAAAPAKLERIPLHLRLYRNIAWCIRENQPRALFDSALTYLQRSPQDWAQLRTSIAHWPEDLDAAQSAAVKNFLTRLVTTIQRQSDQPDQTPTLEHAK